MSEQTFKYVSLVQALVAGDVEEFKKMHQAGYTDNSFFGLASVLALYPNFEIFQYAHANGIIFFLNDRSTIDSLCHMSARNSDIGLQCLMYAAENGAEFFHHHVVTAYKRLNNNNQSDCFKFCLQQLEKKFVASDDKDNFWCPVLEEQYIVDCINLDSPGWRQLLYTNLCVEKWKDFWLENKQAELTDWPLITPKIKAKQQHIELCKQYTSLLVNLPIDIINFCINVYF